MHGDDKENISGNIHHNSHLQPCQNPLERKIFRGRRRGPEGESEPNARLFEGVINQLDIIRKELTDNNEVLTEGYSALVIQNMKVYLAEVFSAKESRCIETTVNFDTCSSKNTYFPKNTQSVTFEQPEKLEKPEKVEAAEKPKVRREKEKEKVRKSSVYESVLLENTNKLRRYRY